MQRIFSPILLILLFLASCNNPNKPLIALDKVVSEMPEANEYLNDFDRAWEMAKITYNEQKDQFFEDLKDTDKIPSQEESIEYIKTIQKIVSLDLDYLNGAHKFYEETFATNSRVIKVAHHLKLNLMLHQKVKLLIAENINNEINDGRDAFEAKSELIKILTKYRLKETTQKSQFNFEALDLFSANQEEINNFTEYLKEQFSVYGLKYLPVTIDATFYEREMERQRIARIKDAKERKKEIERLRKERELKRIRELNSKVDKDLLYYMGFNNSQVDAKVKIVATQSNGNFIVEVISTDHKSNSIKIGQRFSEITADHLYKNKGCGNGVCVGETHYLHDNGRKVKILGFAPNNTMMLYFYDVGRWGSGWDYNDLAITHGNLGYIDAKEKVYISSENFKDGFGEVLGIYGTNLLVKIGEKIITSKEEKIESQDIYLLKACLNKSVCVGDIFINPKRDSVKVKIAGINNQGQFVLHFLEGKYKGQYGAGWRLNDLAKLTE